MLRAVLWKRTASQLQKISGISFPALASLGRVGSLRSPAKASRPARSFRNCPISLRIRGLVPLMSKDKKLYNNYLNLVEFKSF